MKLPNSFRRPRRESGQGNALRGGAYSVAVTAVVLAILIAVNVFASALPATMTRYDISAAQLYSVTSNTKVVVNSLEEDVTIYWIVQSGEEDEVIENLLEKYDSLSSHIQVVKRNPDVYPTFAQQYTDETVQNNSLVVECGDRSRYIAFSDIYLGEINMYTGTYNATDFDGEGAITSALDYVTREELPKLYLLEGHGEAELPESFREQLEKENIELETISLLTADQIPEDADCVMIYAPERDLSPEEAEMLAGYAESGGRLLVAAGAAQESGLTNLYSILAGYGVTGSEGIVIEGDREHYAFQSPYCLLPDLNSHAVTDPLIEEAYRVILPLAQGLDLSGAGENVTSLLTTSEQSFSKVAGYDLDTYEKEEGDIDGPFSLGVAVECGNEGQIVWFSSGVFLEEAYNALSSGANQDLVMNAVSGLIGESEAMAIRSRSLDYHYLTINAATASLLQVVMIGAIPLLYLGIGIYVVLKRRRMQHVSV